MGREERILRKGKALYSLRAMLEELLSKASSSRGKEGHHTSGCDTELLFPF